MNLLGNFLYILHLMVAFIAIFLFWQVARWLVLPHLQIFPRIPPNPLWEGAYSALVAAATAVFWIAVCIILFLYVVYKIIEWYVPNIPFPPIPIKDILLGMTPMREMRESGLVALFDRIFFNLIPVVKPIKEKLKDIVDTFGEYLRNSFGFTKQILTEIGKPVVDKVYSKVDQAYSGATNMVVNTTTSIASNTVSGAKSIGSNLISDTLPPENEERSQTSPKISSQEEKFIEKEYQQCLIERQQPIVDDMSGLQKASAITKNSLASTICKAKKMQQMFKLYEYKS